MISTAAKHSQAIYHLRSNFPGGGYRASNASLAILVPACTGSLWRTACTVRPLVLGVSSSVEAWCTVMSKVLIVRGGLVGLSAACELLERGCSVTILEKSHNLGGNASKAITGIAAPGSELQKANGVADSGADLVAAKPICKEMVQQGSKDVDWLLNLAARMGWYSVSFEDTAKSHELLGPKITFQEL